LVVVEGDGEIVEEVQDGVLTEPELFQEVTGR
jgi:hypothetical protein